MEELSPFLPGDATGSWGITTGLTVRRSRYVLGLPSSVKPRLKEENLSIQRQERTRNGRTTYTWAAQDIPRVKSEAFASDSSGVWQSIEFALPISWSDIGRFYAKHAEGRYAPTPALDERLSSILEGASTVADSVRAIHRYVAQDVRYVSVSLGIGAYQPRAPDEVMQSGFGDCKDKATIFVAMLNRIGLEAYPVLLNSGGGVTEDMPSLTQFDHAIAAYRMPGDPTWHFTDLTSELTPLGELPYGPQGEFGIIVWPDGKVQEVTLPLSRLADNNSGARFVGELSGDGTVNGAYEEWATGRMQYQVRSVLSAPYDATQEARFRDGLAAAWFEGGTGSDLRLIAGKDLSAEVRIGVRVNNARGISQAGRSSLLPLPIANMSELGALVRELESAGPRRFPIAALSIFGYGQGTTELELTLPEGWTAELPDDVVIDSDFGIYHKTYRQEGRVLTVRRFVSGKEGTLPPERIDDLFAFFKALSKDDASVLVISR